MRFSITFVLESMVQNTLRLRILVNRLFNGAYTKFSSFSGVFSSCITSNERASSFYMLIMMIYLWFRTTYLHPKRTHSKSANKRKSLILSRWCCFKLSSHWECIYGERPARRMICMRCTKNAVTCATSFYVFSESFPSYM